MRHFLSRPCFQLFACASSQLLLCPGVALASDGAYGRLDGDVSISAEIGVSEALGDDETRGESFAVRAGLFFLHSAGIVGQYNESFGAKAQPIARSVSADFEIRPFFLGRFARDMQQGPAYLDLWLDGWSLTLGVYNLWRAERFCPPAGCHDFGMQFSVGTELPLLPQANTPFISLRGAVRWSLNYDVYEDPDPAGLLTLSIGYHHLFETHLVDIADPAPDP